VKSVALAALLLLTALASGQWLEKELPLLEAAGLPEDSRSLAYNNLNRTVYVSGAVSDSILVIDAVLCRAVERVAVGGGVRAMCYNSVENKLYCAYTRSDTVVVLDGTTHQMLAMVGVGDHAGTFCYDSIDNKLYVANWGSASVTVIDCRDDRVVATIDSVGGGFGFAPNAMCFASTSREVFCLSPLDSSVVAIDCSADTVVAVIHVDEDPSAVCYNPSNNRVYCVCTTWEGALYGIDATSNRVVSTVPGGRYSSVMACDPVRNVLFVPDCDMLVVVDCSADTIVAYIEVPVEDAGLVGCSPLDGKVYVADGEGG